MVYLNIKLNFFGKNVYEKGNMNLITKTDKNLFKEISQLIEQTKNKIATQTNSGLTILFWEVGQKINVHILNN